MATDPRLERIGQLAAVALGLEREGCYNGAKLVRALLDRELLRHADAHAPVGGPAVADALHAALADLGDAGAPFQASLVAAETAVRAGTTLALAEAPRVRACRNCGELFLGEDAPAVCPTCEAPALSFREHLPVWYLEPAEPGAITDALEAGPPRIAALLAGRSDESLARPPAAGAWSVREVLEHLLFAEELCATRIDRLLTEEGPDLAARAVWSETPPADEGSLKTGATAHALLARRGALRAATVARLRGLDTAAWARPGQHAEWGRVTVLSQAAYFARHEASHMAQLAAAARGRLPSTAGDRAVTAGA